MKDFLNQEFAAGHVWRLRAPAGTRFDMSPNIQARDIGAGNELCFGVTVDESFATATSVEIQVITSANIGCITHLQSGADVPVRHWVELVDDALSKSQ